MFLSSNHAYANSLRLFICFSLCCCCCCGSRDSKYNDDTTSRDSDSLIQEYGNISTNDMDTHCWHHPKVRENWRTVLAAVTLLIVGLVLVVMGIFALTQPNSGSQGAVFLLAGNYFDSSSICCFQFGVGYSFRFRTMHN